MNCCCVIGPVKSGTTLLISLLDSHPDLTLFPMEVKFLTHWFENLSNRESRFHNLNQFFFEKSKIKLMNRTKIDSADIMNSGRIDFSGFDFELLYKKMKYLERQEFHHDLTGNELIRKYIIQIHSELVSVLGDESPKTIVLKEGNHGVRHLVDIDQLFPDTKYIVVIRDPRDIYVSLKTIAQKIQKGVSAPSFKSNISPCQFVYNNEEKNIITFTRLLESKIDEDRFQFVKYEDLIENPAREMKKLANFLNIEYSDVLLRPSNFGKAWGGNASSMEKFDGIAIGRVEKWRTALTKSECRVLSHFFREYLSLGEYWLVDMSPTKARLILDIVLTELKARPFDWANPARSTYYLGKSLNLAGKAITSCLFEKSPLGM